MRLEEKHAWYWLACHEVVGIKTIGKLISEYKTALNIYYCKNKDIEHLLQNKKAVEVLCNRPLEEDILTSYGKLADKGIHFVTAYEPEFPKRLKYIADAPYFLFYKGRLPVGEKPAISIVGARACTVYGAEVARDFAGKLSKAGIDIISGFAAGIDRYAHEGALKENGYNVGVLGNGVDVCYPVTNMDLYEKVLKNGAFISEYPPGTHALPYHFPVRNRIVSGLSDGVLVVEARKRSGSMITVEYALEQGKNVYCIPGRITDRLSVGCNALIQIGAKLTECVEDILEDIKIQYPDFKTYSELNTTEEAEEILKTLSEKEKRIIRHLGQEALHIDVLIMRTGMGYQELVNILFSLELRGIAKSEGSCFYRLNKGFEKKC